VILAAGLSPAWQEIFVFDEFARSRVNRAREVCRSVGGKVFNSALAAHSLGADVRVVSIVGGENGECVRRDLEAQGLQSSLVESSSPTRSCTTIIDASRPGANEKVENAPPVAEDELEEFRARFREEAKTAEIILLAGSLPQGAPPTLFRDLLKDAPSAPDALSIVDAAGDVLRYALEAEPFLVKPNRLELEAHVGRNLDSVGEILEACRELHRDGATHVVVSDGPRDTVVSTSDDGPRVFTPPAVREVNSIGCGDAMAGGIAQAFDARCDIVEAVKIGLAAAADNLEQVWMGRLDRERVDDYSRQIEARYVEP